MDPSAVGGDPAAIWKFVSFTLSGVVVVIASALVKVSSLLLAERMARLVDRETVIAKLEAAREAKNRRENTERRES